MGVYIKNFEIPHSCDGCPFEHPVKLDEHICELTDEKFRARDIGWGTCNHKRLESCPLIKVPVPHGRLADCDAVEECLKEVADCETKDYAMMLLDWAVSKRTVIEGEQ